MKRLKTKEIETDDSEGLNYKIILIFGRSFGEGLLRVGDFTEIKDIKSNSDDMIAS